MTINVPLSEWNPQTRAVVQEVDGLFTGFGWGTYPGHDPSQARAADAMVPSWGTATGQAKGWDLAEWIWAHRGRYNIWYVIFRRKIISQTRPAAGWIDYRWSGAYTASKAHDNHVHVSTYPAKPDNYGTVWLDRLQPGVTDSDSVRIVQQALNVPPSGAYDAATIAAAQRFQRDVLGDAEQYCDGLLGKSQTVALLTRRDVWATLRTDPSGTAPPAIVDPPAPEQPELPDSAVTYTVRSGDTLTKIAARLDLGWRDLAALNPGIDPDRLAVGQAIIVPRAIPAVEPAPKYPAPASGEVYLDKIAANVVGSDTVWYVQTALNKVGIKVAVTGTYDAATVAAVKTYQASLGDAPQYCDGLLGEKQTLRLFSDAKMAIQVYRSSTTGGLVNVDPKAPSVPVKPFSVPMREWGGNAGRTLIQGFRIHQPSGTRIVNQADTVKGQRRQDIVWRMHTDGNKYLGAVWAKNVGHGSTCDIYSTGPTSFELWFRNEARKQTGYVSVKVGQRGVITTFHAVGALPYGDPAIDQDADLVCIRYGNRFRGYRLSAAKAGKTVKLWDFTIPKWGNRFQGHLIHDDRLYVHRDVKTKGASRAHQYGFDGKQTDWLDTTKMGDEAEGFVVVDGTVCVVKRVGGDNAGRTIRVTPWR